MIMDGYFIRVAKHTPTRFWVNNSTREEARLAIEAGAVGCTQNPAYLSKVIKSESDGPYIRAALAEILAAEQDVDRAIAELQRKTIQEICALFLPLYKESRGEHGYVSIQGDPFHEDVATILDNAHKSRALCENMIIKIPATAAGLQAMETLVREGVPILATEVMSMDQVIRLCTLRAEALRETERPAPFYLAHINGIFDEHLAEYAAQAGADIDADTLYYASFALSRKITQYLRFVRSDIHYLAGGARGLHHFTDLVGVDGDVTINWRGTADALIANETRVVERYSAQIPFAALDALLRLPDFYKAYTPGALQEDDYESFGPVVRFRKQFEAGWQALRDLIGKA